MARNIRLDDEREHVRLAREGEERRRAWSERCRKEREEEEQYKSDHGLSSYEDLYMNRTYGGTRTRTRTANLRQVLHDAGIIIIRRERGTYNDFYPLWETSDGTRWNDPRAAQKQAHKLVLQRANNEVNAGNYRSIGSWSTLTDNLQERSVHEDGVELFQRRNRNGETWVQEVIVHDEPEYVELPTMNGRIERVRIR